MHYRRLNIQSLNSKSLALLALTLVPTVGALGFMACSSSTDPGTSDDASYAGLGSKWSAEFTNGTDFTVSYDKEADGALTGAEDFTATGTYNNLTTGYLKLTVAAVTAGASAQAPAVGDEAYALEIPGFGLFLKPVGASQSEPIVMIKSGECPTSAFDANWIIAKYIGTNTPNNTTSDAFGGASFTISGTSVAATIEKFLFTSGGPTTPPTSSLSGTCASGEIDFDVGGDTGTMLLTTSGGALVKPGSSGNLIFAAPKYSADVTSSDWDGTYSALAFTSNGGTENTFPAKMTLSGAGGTGVQYTDVETGTVSAGGVTLAGLAAVSGTEGHFRGTIDTSHGPQPLNCMLSAAEGKKVLACNGGSSLDSGTGVYEPFFLLGVAQ
jgi:hypothetical protein